MPAGDAERTATIAADALARAVDPAQHRQLRLVLRLLEEPLANLATGEGLRSFGAMEAAQRERLLLRWALSPIALRRSAFNAFRKLLTFIAYADPGTPGVPNPLPGAIGYRADDPSPPASLSAIGTLDVDRVASEPLILEADVVIVGSGAGGGVMAAEVASAGRDVLVVEAGPFVDETSMPRDELDAYGRLYLNHGLLSTWDGAITMLAGSGVGGGTLVNWMTCLDIPADIRTEWASDHGLDGLDGAEWAADVMALESELGVSPTVVVPPKDELLRRGAATLGWHAAVTRRNAGDCGDCGSCPFGCRRGTKRSGPRVHLAEAAERGARIMDRARVLAIVRDDEGGVAGVRGLLAPAEGLDGAESGEPRPFGIHAHQVVLAAGALRSPAVLQAAGIDHPSVGRHLRIHPVAVVGAILAEPVDMWRGTMQAVHSLEFGAEGRGRRRYVVESAPGHLGLMALVVPWLGAADHAAEMARARHFAPLIAITRDGGEGRVSLTGSGRVRIDYRLDDLGRATLRHALGSMARIARAAGAEEILALGLPPARYRAGADGDAEARFAAFAEAVARLSLAPNRVVVGSAHQMGTLRMGADPVDHPADPRGRVRADRSGRVIRGLYVADGSTFPTGVGVNPMVGIMAMARRVSRTVRSEAPPR